MSNIISVDLNKLAETVGVPSEMFTPPVPNAQPMLQYAWSKEHIAPAVEVLRKDYPEPGTHLAFLGHVDIWICLALAYGVEDTCKCYFASPNHDEANTFAYVPLDPLPLGEKNPEVYFEYKSWEEGDFLFMEYAVDDPSAGAGHTFFNDSIEKLVLPEIAHGKYLCLHGGGIYPVQWAVSHTYRQFSKAIFTAAHDDKFYTCAWCADGTYQPGDKVERK